MGWLFLGRFWNGLEKGVLDDVQRTLKLSFCEDLDDKRYYLALENVCCVRLPTSAPVAL